jgi:hypothetical protein
MMFGHLFGLKAIVLSDILSRSSTTPEVLLAIVKSLLKFADSKAYLRLASYEIIVSIATSISYTNHHLSDQLTDILNLVFEEKSELVTPEDLWFVICLQNHSSVQNKVIVVPLYIFEN